MSPQTALITGASGGLGLAFAHKFAENNYNLVLVARSEDKLRQLASDLQSAHGITARVLPGDLTDADLPATLHSTLQDEGVAVDVLVNNAGFASYGLFHELDLQRELNMIQLNIAALTHLTHRFLGDMVARDQGRILNVASTAAFLPGPLMAVYYASKAFVLHFSEALANELKGTGVTVTTLCPGPTRTGFQSRADMEESKLVQNGLMDARTVAEAGYQGLLKGQAIVVPGLMNKINITLPRFLPRGLVTTLVRRAQERSGDGGH